MHRWTPLVIALLFLSSMCIQAQPKKEIKAEEKASNETVSLPETVDKESKKKGTTKSKSKSTKSSDNSTETPGDESKLPTSRGCGAGCEICHEDHCFSCKNDYQRIDYKCQKKGCSDPRCRDCSSNVCYRCVDGFAPDDIGVCKWIGPSGCQEKNCMLCETTRVACTECIPGFQLRSNRCYKNACKDKNCLRCSSNGKKCELCKDGFQSRLGGCLEVGCLDDHCRQCSPSGGSCYHCIDGYYSDRFDRTCKSCPDENCIDCSGSQRSCIKCVEGYYAGRLASGKNGCVECNKAVDNCDICDRQGDECYSCTDGYYLEHGHCIDCPSNCASCKSPWLCDRCKEGYDLFSNGLCQPGKNASLKSNGVEEHLPCLILVALANILLTAALL